LEGQLSEIFDLANHWNAILLLDEADVFLEKRSPQSLDRNGLVSVFLRILEYFQGILVLTTNRVETFDDAVQSRVNLPLKFKGLDESAKKAIWTTFIERSCKAGGGRNIVDVVSPEQLESLARKELNGREVRCFV
jgi:SpoVK/Ycf46/Vps4 family AAA+-type ATPase